MNDSTGSTTSSFVPLPYVPATELKWSGESVQNWQLSPAQAIAILERWRYGGQRKIREPRVRTYLSMMESGDWQERSELHVGVLPDNRHYLLNGYHRLSALARINPELGFAMKTRIIFTGCEDEARLASLYGVIDNLGARNYNDAIYAAGLAEEWDVPFDYLRAMGSAGGLIRSDFSASRSNSADSARGRSTPGRIQFLYDWQGEIVAASNILRQATSKVVRKALLRAPVMAVMLMTLRYEPERAIPFWTEVATGIGMTVGSGAKALLDYLMNNGSRSSHEHIYARYVANCWNAWRSRQEILWPQVKSKGIADPIVIEGTPFSRVNRLKAYRERTNREPRQASKKVIEEAQPGVTDETPSTNIPSESRLLSSVSVLLGQNYGPSPEQAVAEEQREPGGAREEEVLDA